MQRYAADGVGVLAVVNQDMTGYSPNNVIAVYTDYVDAALTAFVQTLVPAYTGLPLSTDRCGYGCSDQLSPLPASFFLFFFCSPAPSLPWRGREGGESRKKSSMVDGETK